MTGPNLYWPIYKNLEKEVLKLADYVHFADDQVNIYSSYIADLIIRSAAEIEALSKELYYMVVANINDKAVKDLYFDTDCLNLLEEKWKLSKKQITISAINFYFTDSKRKVLSPLYKANKRGTSGSRWKQAYQALKHDRKNSLKKGTIENLLHIMGALYILNLYYRAERTDIGRIYLSDHTFDTRVGSDIFSVFCYRATGLTMSENLDDSCITPYPDNDLDKAIYVIKYDEKSFEAIHKNFCLDLQDRKQRFSESVEIANFLQNNPEYRDKSIHEICMAAGGRSLFLRIISFEHARSEKTGRMEAMINKHSRIYPELRWQKS